ncbi:MAG: MBL fold metallo-hydrolase [Bacteroidetes bacterium]|jgi:glyoxylase-like metal-dependent hydrolase (beta-lactamase superfamily II)|nr:MBL fold metallo-hydrolase [Bacteroidota bacterium]
MEFAVFTFNPFQENTYVVWDDTKNCVLIDPGSYYPSEIEEITRFIDDNGLHPHSVLNTHCHLDHVFGVQHFKSLYQIPFVCHLQERANLDRLEFQAGMFGIRLKYPCPEPDVLLGAESQYQFGNTVLRLLFVPGHSPGHLAFYHQPSGVLLGGDVLFREGIGRTDLPGSSQPALVQSIQEVLYALPGETRVLPGHMGETTIGHEKRHNPYVRAKT